MTYRPGPALRAAVLVAASLLLTVVPVVAQTPAPEPAQPQDPMGRDTPRGAFMGFVAAAEAGNLATAGQYLQWPGQGMAISRDEAARQLQYVLNHSYEGNLDRLSRDPQGSVADGRPNDREWVGTAVLANGERVDLLLSRVGTRDGPQAWLFSADTVLEIPRMYDNSGLPEFERQLPRFLTGARFGELSLWVPTALAALLAVLYVLSRFVLWIVAGLVRLVSRWRHKNAVPARWKAWSMLSHPAAFLLTIGLHRLLAPFVGIPLLYRHDYDWLSIILLAAGLVWLLWRLIDVVAGRVRDRLQADYPRTGQSMYTLGRRILKGAAVLLAMLIALAAMGVNLSATLAGLGIGGVALAFAAQKTLENIFGGISVLSDRSIVVGDYCKIGSHVGTVEDVGMRTTMLRTLNRTVVHVPNGSVAALEVENFTRRDKFFFNPTIGLRYETSLEQLQRVLEEVRQMLVTDARVERETARARFIRFGSYSLDVEVFGYVTAADYAAFLVVQEELLMRIMAIVKHAGTGLAFPSQTMYLRRDPADGPRDVTIPPG